MTLGAIAQILAFSVFSLIAVGGGLGMATTMSMFRSGIFLMASFIGVAGLFILLSADLLSLLQIMMYIGGMLVMILFMVLFSHDPGGEMMVSMEMATVERFFSLGIQPMQMEHGEHSDGMEHQEGDQGDEEHHNHHHSDDMDMNEGNQGGDTHHNHHHNNMQMSQESQGDEEHHSHHHSDGHGNMDHEHQGGDMHGGMDMSDMSMVTPIRPLATVLAILIGTLLVALLLLRPAWPISHAIPNPNSARMVGSLLMGKYMMGFEGAGLLILTGIFGAVLLSQPGSHPSEKNREARVEVDAPPAPIEDDPISLSNS